MIHFDCDYMEGACPEIMGRLMELNLEQTAGYGNDEHTRNAERLILEACGLPEGKVYFLVGGTQTNSTVIDGLLGRHEGVLSVESGHINVHESGAIEATGHKVLVLPSHDGKALASDVENYIKNFYADETYEHMVAPGMLYISHPTEMGTLYSLAELEALSDACHKAGIPLFMDGARLGYGLAADNDVTIRDIARLCDVFYIGGTKVGALFGEAVVCRKPIPHFTTLIKQHGALLAKGKLLGIQFETLFTDNLYMKIAGHAIEMAMKLRKGFIDAGHRAYNESRTNQQFFYLKNEDLERLQKVATFELWGPKGETETLVRFVTSWATRSSDIDTLIEAL